MPPFHWIVGEAGAFHRKAQALPVGALNHCVSDGLQLIRGGRDLIFYIARARTPMPKSTRDYLARCEIYRQTGWAPTTPVPLPT